MGEKTEKATPKKLRDARKKGQIAKSQDLPSAFTFIASVSATLVMSGYLYDRLSGFTVSTFKLITQSNLSQVIPNVFSQAIETIFMSAIPILVLVVCVGVIINFLSVGPVFAIEAFKPDIKKFDPIQNLKSKFKMKTLFELLKSLFKISVAAYLIFGVVYKSLPVLIKTTGLPIGGSLLVFHAFLIEVLIKVGLLFIIVAVADFVYQKHNFAKEMKMEKFEVKQEHKNSEGDPQIKGKRKQIAQEIAYSDGPSGGVQKSKAVVTNPTHHAIAVGYEREVDSAPVILAMGSGALAKRIVELAQKHKKPVLRNVKLAHKLIEDGELFEYVPEDSYEAIAEVLRWVASLEEENDTELIEEESEIKT